MSCTEISQLIDFLHDQNRQVRMIAVNNLLPYSRDSYSLMHLFKRDNNRPIRDLLVLLGDIPRTAYDAASILINLSNDCEVREILLQREYILLLTRIITDIKSGLADLICMILANLSKSEGIEMLLEIRAENKGIMSKSGRVIDQLMDCFVRGHDKSLNPHATFDFLGNVFCDVTRFETGQMYFCTKQEYDLIYPISKIIVFTSHPRVIRRTGTASCIKNVLFSVNVHRNLLVGVNILPYLLLPLMGPEEFSEEDYDGMPEECQLLPPEKKREEDGHIITLHLDSLLLLMSTLFGGGFLRKNKVYPIIRELHVSSTNESIKEGVDRIVQLLMREEPRETRDIPMINEQIYKLRNTNL